MLSNTNGDIDGKWVDRIVESDSRLIPAGVLWIDMMTVSDSAYSFKSRLWPSGVYQ